MKISIVVPVYRGEQFLDELYQRVKKAVAAIASDWELILVNDQSPDGSWEIMRKLSKNDPAVKSIDLSRNFGQHFAITAGLTYATGDWIVVMDCDLQDTPEEIPALYQKAQEGYDSVLAQRGKRQDGILKRLGSKVFYQVFSFMTDTRMDPSIANFGIYHRKVIQAILSMGDYIRYFPTMVQWVGFRKTELPVQHTERNSGKSSYSFYKLLKLAINSILTFSDKPLRIIAATGLVVSLLSFVTALVFFIMALTGHIKVQGYASLILTLWFTSGMLMMTVGVVGIYVGKTFSQVKNRPTFLISHSLNLTSGKENDL